jgi:hypothetical protein
MSICMCDIPFDRSVLQLSNGIRHLMPSTDRKLELTAKASMAQPVSQPAVCSNGLNGWTSSSHISGYHAVFHEWHGTNGAWQGHGMCELRVRHGRGTAWARHGDVMSLCVNRRLIQQMDKVHFACVLCQTINITTLYVRIILCMYKQHIKWEKCEIIKGIW